MLRSRLNLITIWSQIGQQAKEARVIITYVWEPRVEDASSTLNSSTRDAKRQRTTVTKQ